MYVIIDLTILINYLVLKCDINECCLIEMTMKYSKIYNSIDFA